MDLVLIEVNYVCVSFRLATRRPSDRQHKSNKLKRQRLSTPSLNTKTAGNEKVEKSKATKEKNENSKLDLSLWLTASGTHTHARIDERKTEGLSQRKWHSIEMNSIVGYRLESLLQQTNEIFKLFSDCSAKFHRLVFVCYAFRGT